MTLLVFSQSLGPAVLLSISNTIFGQSLKSQLPLQAPEANATAIIAAGATKFRDFTSPDDLPGVLVAYSNSVDHVFYLTATTGIVAFVAAFGMGWVDIRKKNAVADGEA